MSRVRYVPKVCAYVTRRGGRELLVFSEPGVDGWQIPKGTLEADERPAAGLARELREETGITEPTDVRRLTTDIWERRPGRKYVRTFYHVTVDGTPDRWRHRVTGDGEEAGTVFHLRWVDRPLDRALALGLDDQLDALPRPVTHANE